MLAEIASRLTTIGDLFAPPFMFVSPGFQRPFSWEVENAERLLADIQAAANSAPDDVYFLGAILLMCSLDNGSKQSLDARQAFAGPDRAFQIVDGQQRLVTFALLFAVLRDLTTRSGPGNLAVTARLRSALYAAGGSSRRVSLRGTDDRFLDHCIGEDGACLVPPVDGATSPAQQCLLEVRNVFVRQLQTLPVNELLGLAEFILERCAIVVIATNAIDRAYQMFTVLNDSGKKLTRADIMKADLIGRAPPARRDELTAIWDGLEARLGDKFEELFGHVRSMSGRGSEAIVDTIRTLAGRHAGGAAAFVTDVIAPAGEVLEVIVRNAHAGTPQSAAINRLLRYLNWSTSKEWLPPLMLFWQRFGRDGAALLSFLLALDRFNIGARIHGLGTDKRTQRMATLTSAVQSAASADGPWTSLQLTREELRGIELSMRDLHRRSPQVCKVVLMRLDEHFGGTPLPPRAAMTIEHILPLKVTAGSQWRIDFSDTDERLRLATCLGNLTLVPSAINDRAGNHDFARKAAVYFGDGSEPMCWLTSMLRRATAWTAVEIEARQTQMVRAVEEIWHFGIARSTT
jgi:uncharacterized protein DUF262/uncharacterized protein DUF1524